MERRCQQNDSLASGYSMLCGYRFAAVESLSHSRSGLSCALELQRWVTALSPLWLLLLLLLLWLDLRLRRWWWRPQSLAACIGKPVLHVCCCGRFLFVLHFGRCV